MAAKLSGKVAPVLMAAPLLSPGGLLSARNAAAAAGVGLAAWGLMGPHPAPVLPNLLSPSPKGPGLCLPDLACQPD
jgi:hypothetical protein